MPPNFREPEFYHRFRGVAGGKGFSANVFRGYAMRHAAFSL
jgi:hypothetical protein